MRITSRLGILIAQHNENTGRKWTYDDISQATGVATSTLSAYAQNKVRRFDAVTVEALMEFFGIDHCEFFRTVRESEKQYAEASAKQRGGGR